MADLIPKEAIDLARPIAEAEKSDVYLYSGPINELGYGGVVKALFHEQDSAILVLATQGGLANSAYRIARLFQSFYTKFSVLVPSYCKSAGTLITLGAHRLIMTQFAELGPLDVQLSKRDELWEQRSGLLLRSSLTTLNERADDLFSKMLISIKSNSKGAVRFKLASELAADLARGLLSPIYGQISPEGLGEDYQELMVAYEYGKRLASVGGLVSEDAINRLVHEYPSHDFVIDQLEAKELFYKVESPTAEMYALIANLGTLAYAPHRKISTVEPLSKPAETEKETQSHANATSDSREQRENATADRISTTKA